MSVRVLRKSAIDEPADAAADDDARFVTLHFGQPFARLVRLVVVLAS